MGLSLSSPRVRRRLAWCSIGVTAAGAIALAFLLLPEPKQPSTTPTGKPGSAQVAQPTSVRVRPADRRAINKVLDRFIPDGVGRRSMTAAWRLAGPELKAGSTLGEWRKDVSPIPYYPAAGNTFHDWITLDAGPKYVEFALLLHPRRGARRGAWAFSGEVIRRGPHWLVNRLYTAATYNRAGAETGPPDITEQGGATAPAPKPALGRGWLIGIICTILIVVAFTPTLLLALFLRDRLRRRHVHPLPPLPLSVAMDSRGRPGAGGGA
jgi:hypothetical protein